MLRPVSGEGGVLLLADVAPRSQVAGRTGPAPPYRHGTHGVYTEDRGGELSLPLAGGMSANNTTAPFSTAGADVSPELHATQEWWGHRTIG